MPSDKDKDTTVVDTAVLTHEQKIKELTDKVAALEADNAALAKSAETQIDSLKLQLKERATAQPSGDYAVFGGVTYKIIGDFRADNTFSEVKKGHCDEGITLLAIERPH